MPLTTYLPLTTYFQYKSDLDGCVASSTDGYWDPEKWSRSFDKDQGSRGNSPLAFANLRDRKRTLEADREPFKRKAPCKTGVYGKRRAICAAGVALTVL